MNDCMETWSIDKDEDGGYSQTNGKCIERIFTPVQVAAIKQIMQDDVKEKTQLSIRSRGMNNE